MKNIVIIGSGGHAKVIIDIVEKEGKYNIVGLLDKNCNNRKTLGYYIIGNEESLPHIIEKHNISGGIVAIGDNFIRSKIVENVKEIYPRFKFVVAIHPESILAKDVSIGEGTVVMASSIINPSCTIGNHCIINTSSSIDHDSIMEDYSSIAPGATTGGNVQIGRFSSISIGVTVIHNVHIGKHSVIGAGSTVLKNIGSFKIAYGLPAREIRKRKCGEKYL